MHKVSLKLFENPSLLSKEEVDKFTKEFSLISWKATGGEHWETYLPAKEGWERYYLEEGSRPQDYDRLVVVFDENNKVIHFTGLTIFETQYEKIVWVHIIITEPEYQGNGFLKNVLFKLFDEQWLRSLGKELIVMFRTPNPLVYYTMTQFSQLLIRKYKDISFDYHPKINRDGVIEEIPDHIQKLGQRISKLISPQREFIPSKFIIKGYYKDYGALYENHDFRIRNESLQNVFRQFLDDSNEDGFFIIIQFKFN